MSSQSLFKALADPTRRDILVLLQKGSLSAGEIADHFTISKASISHHFNLLKAADLVRTERRGQKIVYSLNTSVIEDAMTAVFALFHSRGGKS